MTTTTSLETPAESSRARPREVRRPRRSRRGVLLVTLLLSVVAVIWFLPFLLLVNTSIRTATDFLSSGPLALPRSFTVQNFIDGWQTGNFATTYVNSGLITLVKVPIGVIISAMMAYALAKMKVRFRTPILFTVFLGLTIPIYIALLPLFNTVKTLGLIDNVFGLLGPYLAFGIPFEVLVLHSFFRRLPNEILEAARVDGAGPWRIFVGIVLPLSVPALITVAILDAVATWNELLMALIILSSDKNKTIPLGLLNFNGQFNNDYNGLAAGILIAVIPLLVAYALLQRFIVSGLTAGAIKG